MVREYFDFTFHCGTVIKAISEEVAMELYANKYNRGTPIYYRPERGSRYIW